MRERPILFSAPMVRAILDGRKTQTRRVAKLNYAGRVALRGRQWHVDDPNAFLACPYGVPGDRLWVREAWATPNRYDGIPPRLLPRDTNVYYADTHACGRIMWRAPIHMPRWASRITLEIVNVRVQRLQQITSRDAEAEGVRYHNGDFPLRRERMTLHQHCFAHLWDALNAKRGHGWDENPLVWRIEFRRIEPAEREG